MIKVNKIIAIVIALLTIWIIMTKIDYELNKSYNEDYKIEYGTTFLDSGIYVGEIMFWIVSFICMLILSVHIYFLGE